MVVIFDLPPETIEEILLNCDPLVVAAAAKTCRFFRRYIYHSPDQHLWRALYLIQPLDDPRTCVTQTGRPRQEIDWKGELQRIIRARSILENPTLSQPGESWQILRTLLHMVCHTPPASPINTDGSLSQNLLWVAAVLRNSTLLDQPLHGVPADGEGAQMRSQLHTYYGLTHEDVKPVQRVSSRAYVYNLRRYRSVNDYGPYMMDGSGRVNWVHLQAIHHVVSMHIVDLQEDEGFEYVIFPMSLPYTQVLLSPGVDLDHEPDWAGVTGVWSCAFCFCDHRDLLVFNHQSHDMDSPDEPMDTSLFQDPEFREAFRSLRMKLQVTHTVFNDRHPTRPDIYFAGDMMEMTGGGMTGCVRMSVENQIRWQFVSGESGNTIWSSEGVQIGGVRSSFGVLGAWTTIFHDPEDPVGPFWLRKMMLESTE